MRYFRELVEAVDRVRQAEQIAPRGSLDCELVTKVALYQAWATIYAFVEANRAEQGFPLGRSVGRTIAPSPVAAQDDGDFPSNPAVNRT